MKRLMIAALVAAAVLAVPATASASSLRTCDKTATGWTIKASKSTSCSFAKSTYRALRHYQRVNGAIELGDRITLPVYSFVTGKWYSMRCKVAETRFSIDCRGGNNARVVLSHS